METYLKRSIALPQDHGSWVFLFSPLLIGLFAGERFHLPSSLLILTAVAAFLIRQPVTIAVKALSGRRPRSDLPAARFWIIVYGLLVIAGLAGLAAQGFAFIFLLAIPALPVFAWHLLLVSKRAERKQAGVEILATGVLALAAPAAYWTGQEASSPAGWWLWALTWLQSAASIVYAYLRLSQRDLKSLPAFPERLQMGWRALLYTTFNLLAVIGLSLGGGLPKILWAGYALQWLETLWGSLLRPAIGWKPTAIGFRQLGVSVLFTVLFIFTWRS